MTSWAVALDEFEQNLDACRSMLDDNSEPDHRPWPPAEVIGEPLPLEMVERAQELVRRANELEYEIMDRQISLPELRPAPRRRRNPGMPTVSTEL